MIVELSRTSTLSETLFLLFLLESGRFFIKELTANFSYNILFNKGSCKFAKHCVFGFSFFLRYKYHVCLLCTTSPLCVDLKRSIKNK